VWPIANGPGAAIDFNDTIHRRIVHAGRESLPQANSHRLDLEELGDAEAFGALAVSRQKRHRKGWPTISRFTAGQARVFSELADSLVKIVKEVGANHKIVKFGDIAVELHEEGTEEFLSIRKAGR
jgi:hypothetical protein